MVTATFTQDRESESIIMRVSGHAGAAAKGHDLICAAFSILCYTGAQVMQYMFEERKLREKPQISLKEGDSIVVAKPKREYWNECLHGFFVIQAGMAILARSYPKYAELISFGEPEETGFSI